MDEEIKTGTLADKDRKTFVDGKYDEKTAREDQKQRAFRKKFMIVVALGVTVFIVVFLFFLLKQDERKESYKDLNIQEIAKKKKKYHTREDVEKTLARLESMDPDETASLIEKKEVSQKKIALIFTGLAEQSQMEQIVRILGEYNDTASFFVSGKSAAEDPDSLNVVRDAGFEIGNLGFDGERHMETFSEEDIVISVAKTQSIIRTVSERQPLKFTGNAISYDDHVLHSIAACGIESAVKPAKFLAWDSFDSFTAAMGFVKTLNPGDIVCFKLDDYLDEIEYEEFEQDERQDPDFRDPLEEESEEKPEPDLVNTFQYLAEALRTARIPVVSLERNAIDFEADLEDLFNQEEDAAAYQIKESDPAEADYLSDALFIGDSLTLTLDIWEYPSGLKGTSDICAYKSVTPQQFVNNAVTEDSEGKEVHIWDEVLSHKEDEKVYILLGANSLAVNDNDTLLKNYGILLDMAAEEFEGKTVVVQGMLPVTESASDKTVTMTNGRIRDLNVRIARMAKEKGLLYLDLYSGFMDEAGNLPYEFAQEDGIHLNSRGTGKWVDYILRHIPPMKEMKNETEETEETS